MKTLKLTAALFAVSLALASCTGDDGEPGPKGDAGAQGAAGATGAAGEGIEKAGYFQGTVSGKKSSGADFSETFKFEYGTGTQAFYESYGNKWLSLYRYNAFYYYTSGLEVAPLQLSGNNLVAVPDYSQIYFFFTKEASTTDLFTVYAVPYFKDRESYVVRLSDEQNATYNFLTAEGNIYYNSSSWNNNGTYVAAHVFIDKDDKYELFYSTDDGSFLGYFDQTTALRVTSGTVFDLYNELTFKTNTSLNALTFYDKGTKNSLHSIVPAVPADQFTVTNYVHDATTGNLSFNYVLKISKYRSKTGGNYGRNSTGNDLLVSGSFHSGGKVYKNSVSRTATGG